MSRTHKPREHLWAVCRIDAYQTDPEEAMTIVRVMDSQEAAELEQARLQALNPPPDTRYFVQITRRYSESAAPATTIDLVAELQRWYRAQCDGEWEHDKGITIDTLDNPGWSLRINLVGTDLESRTFQAAENLPPASNWYKCWVEGGFFQAVGGPNELGRLLRTFSDWASAEPAV